MRVVRMALCSFALTLPIAALARAPYTHPGNEDARLRFSWRMSVSAKETCLPRTEAELAAMAVHMRTPEVCSRDVASYTLISRIDELAPDTVRLARGGVKGDRPLFVQEERTLPAGARRVRVRLERSTASSAALLAAIDTVLAFHPGAIHLVTLDDLTQQLTARSSPRHAHRVDR